jgi:hypothetical protein
MLRELAKKETEFIRFRRLRLTHNEFENIKLIGRGAFGEVRTLRFGPETALQITALLGSTFPVVFYPQWLCFGRIWVHPKIAWFLVNHLAYFPAMKSREGDRFG